MKRDCPIHRFFRLQQDIVDQLTRLVGWDHEGLSGNNEDSEEKSGAEHGQICLFGNCGIWDALHVRFRASGYTATEYDGHSASRSLSVNFRVF